MQDINQDGIRELILPKLSDIVIMEPNTRKVIRRIKIKPKAEKKVHAYEREIITSTSNRDIAIERRSVAGEILLKIELCDINHDSKYEIVLARADGILACYTCDGKEIWSIFEDPHITDFIVGDINDDLYYETISVSRHGMLYVTLHNGKTLRTFVKDIYGMPSFIRIIEIETKKYVVVVTKSGIVYLLKIRISKKPVLGQKLLVEVERAINLNKYGSPTVVYASPTIMEVSSSLVLGFDSGKVVAVDIKSDTIREFELKDKIVCIGPIPIVNKHALIASDWSGNVLLMEDSKSQYMFALPRKMKLDLNGDGIDEIVSVFTKEIRILKNNAELFSVKGRSYITSCVLDDIDNDNNTEVVLGWRSGGISIYDLNGQLIESIKTISTPKGLIAVDVNSDQKKEIICCGIQTIEIYSFD